MNKRIRNKKNKQGVIKYLVSEVIDEDGGFGDAVSTLHPLAVFDDFKKANRYKEKYSNPVVFAKPYEKLEFGKLAISEVEVNPTKPVDELNGYLRKEDLYGKYV